MQEPLTYWVVQTTDDPSLPKHKQYERLGYHYSSVADVLLHMDWAKEMLRTTDESGLHLSSFSVCPKRWNAKQHQDYPPLPGFVMLYGQRIPDGGRTFKTI